jgi:hypothetical protein
MSNQRTFWITWAVCLLLNAIACLLLYTGFISYGIVLFCVLPGCIGLFTGFIPRRVFAIVGMVAALLTIFLLLWAGQVEGIVCILMALPIVGVSVLVGYIFGIIIKRLSRKEDSLKISFLPIVLFGLAVLVNHVWKGGGSENTVTTTIELNASSADVYNHIKQVDTVIAKRHFLHELGLPYPHKCVLTAEREGGQRICEFDAGRIVETIVQLKKDELLRMKVSEYDLPGASWFAFDEDIYQIRSVGNVTRISRTTTVFSKLKPRLYWEQIEKLTIGIQQELVFENLKNEIEQKR